jgi:probable O-glycosylation ligase (exosortase A-associated)
MLPVRDIIVLTIIIASLPVCFFRPYFGILMWTVVALLNPHRFAWGMAYNQFPVAVAVGVATLAGFVVFFPGLRCFFSRDVYLLMVLWLWFTLTTAHNTAMPEFMHFADDTWFRWRFVSKVLLMTLVTIALVNSWVRLRYLLLVIAGCLAVLVLKAVPFMIMTGGSFRLYGPAGSMLDDNNALGLALNMTLPIFFFLARTETDRRIKWLAIITFVATVPAIFFTYSRGALIGLAAVFLLMVMRLRQRLLLLPILLLAGLFAVYLTPEKWQQRMNFQREGALMDDSAMSRINAWTPELFRIYAPNARDVHGPHSIYFGVLAEHGFIGLFLYLSLITSCFISLHQVRKHALVVGDAPGVNYAVMLQFSLVGFLVSGAFLGRAYFDYFFLIWACTIILKRLYRLEMAWDDVALPETDAISTATLIPSHE